MNTINSKEEFGTMSDGNDDLFNPDSIPMKTPLIKPINMDTGLNSIAYHAEVPFSIRRIFLERAVPNLPELATLNIKKVL